MYACKCLPLYDGLDRASYIRFTMSSRWIQENLHNYENNQLFEVMEENKWIQGPYLINLNTIWPIQ